MEQKQMKADISRAHRQGFWSAIGFGAAITAPLLALGGFALYTIRQASPSRIYAEMDAGGPVVTLGAERCQVADWNLLSPSVVYNVVSHGGNGLREYLDIIGGTSISLADDEPADGIVDTVRIAAYVEVPGGMYSLSREWSTRLWDAPDAMYHDTIRLPGGTGQQLDLWADELMEKYRAQFDIERICIDEWAR